MKPSVGRVLNLTAHAYGRAAKRPEDRVWSSGPSAQADRMVATGLVYELKLETAGALLAAFPLIMLSRALDGSALASVVDFVVYLLVAAPLATMCCMALWILFGPRGPGRRRRRRYLSPAYEDRYNHAPFLVVSTISWAAAVVVAAWAVATGVG